jgi:phosphatidate phosphatase APP1
MAAKNIAIKVYHGYGYTKDLVVYGHTFRKLPPEYKSVLSNSFTNLFRLLRLFFVKPVPRVPLQIIWDQQIIDTESEDDGFFKGEWQAIDTPAGWHPVLVQHINNRSHRSMGEGRIYIPHKTQYAFISDIDDTIMVSYSATIWKRMKELLFKNAHTRTMFPDTVLFYQLLAKGNTRVDEPNPFFYVSSSEWNLYDYLREVFSFNGLPDGAFLLNQVKRWYQLWKTGKTKHEGKLLRVIRILDTFPNQRFILMGDNSQSDPAVYAKLIEKYGHRIFAIYIRNVRKENYDSTNIILSSLLEKGIFTLQFSHSREAIAHAASIGLIEHYSFSTSNSVVH